MDKIDSPEEYSIKLRNSFASSYQTGTDLWSKDQGLTDIALFLLNHLNKESPQHVLDIGTGNGRHAELFLRKGFRYTGIDICPHSDWERYKSLYSNRVMFVNSSFLEWQWQHKETFTAVLDNGCFHHQHPEEYTLYLQKIHHLLHDSGLLALGLYTVDEHERAGNFHVMPSGKYKRHFSQQEILSLLNENGFVCLQMKRILVQDRNRYYLAVLSQKKLEE
ncbi:class I SAM-dependent methyltransferase [Effusibacillus pohliae]|uniref:class I SAM-dependent methyltransferase n=1 Tax=Effusibacillus pohliae TaxID=232270 RepID=UPI00036F5361|nr:class I SAM-dependent methyltransferase [Effusibacillus pohliae]